MARNSPVLLECLEQVSAGKYSEYWYRISNRKNGALVKISRRRRKTLGLQVNQELVELRVPTNCPWREIRKFLEINFEWILSAADEMADFLPVVHDSFLPGGKIRYLGKSYRLNVRKSRFSVVTIDGSELYVTCSKTDSAELIESRVMRWLRRQAESVLADRVKLINERFVDNHQPSKIRVRKMRSRWGSCSLSGEICFNLLLVRECMPQIDFIVAHELCHLRYFEHNASFYSLLDQVMPDWRNREELLKG